MFTKLRVEWSLDQDFCLKSSGEGGATFAQVVKREEKKCEKKNEKDKS